MNATLDALATAPLLPAGIPVPPQFLPSIARHQKNLATLVHSLRGAGLDDAMIEANVRQLVETYRDELMTAVRALIRENAHG